MSDVLTPKQRSFCMSRNRGKNTKPELMLRKALWGAGLRYRKNYPLPGKPDIVFPGAKVTVFVDGCFWHGCTLHYKAPSTNKKFWKNKIEKTKARDIEVNSTLSAMGWQVIRIWEHEIRSDLQECIDQVAQQVQKSATS